MAAEVEAMVLVGQKAWHGLGKVYDAGTRLTKEQVLTEGGLDWEAEVAPIVTNDQVRTAVEDWRVVRRTTDQAILGVVKKGWKPIQNKDALDTFDFVVKAGDALYETAGSLRGGSRTFVLARLPEPHVLASGRDPVDRFVLLSNAFDGTRNLQLLCTPVRVVCSNTLAMALHSSADAGDTWARHSPRVSIVHGDDGKKRLKEGGKVMARALQWYKLFGEFTEHLIQQQADADVVETVVATVFPANAKDEVTPTIQEHRDAVEHLFVSGKGQDIEGVRGSAWALLNGFTEYASHGFIARNKRVKTPSERAYATWLGGGRSLTERANKVISKVFA